MHLDRLSRSPNDSSAGILPVPGQEAAFEPLVEPLAPALTPLQAANRLAALPYLLFLDSADVHPTLGRYSFVTADPFDWLTARGKAGGDPLAVLAERLARIPRSATVAGLPPFQGGAAGLFGYDLCHHIERLPRPRFDEFQTPDLAVGLFDWVAAFDHINGDAWLISTGLPETDPARRRDRAARRLAGVRAALKSSPTSPLGGEGPGVPPSLPSPLGGEGPGAPPSLPSPLGGEGLGVRGFGQKCHPSPPTPLPQGERGERPHPAAVRVTSGPIVEPALRCPLPHLPGLMSNFTRPDYLSAVRRAVEYIHAGDCFQVNLSQRLLYPAPRSPFELYCRVRERNPAPFAGYFDLGDFAIASASPERFLRVQDGRVETRPIKGTRPRGATPADDARQAAELLASAKDRAENVMIIDLLRNDLGRVCAYGSICVSAVCNLESYRSVHHLVSEVTGQLRPGQGPLDLLRAAFPGGSVTGAPKVRAMAIIAELEPTARGPYCGSLGYIGFNGSMDSNILIRTFTIGRGWAQFPVGGGVVADSTPEGEYDETLHKAEGLLRALR